MSKLPFYYIYGNDTDLIEKKWLADLKTKHPKADFTWLDTTIDDINIGKLSSEFSSYNLFCDRRILIIRNADTKQEACFELAEALKAEYMGDNILVLIANGLNQTTKLGKFAKKELIVQEFSLPEIKPFAMLDAINTKNSMQVLQQCRMLLDNDYNALAVYSMVYNHLLLMKKVKAKEGDSPEWIARELQENPFRIKKMMVANRYWSMNEIDNALRLFTQFGKLLRTWQYDEAILLQMVLIQIGL